MDFQRTLRDLLSEILFEAPADFAFILNPGTPGLLATLDSLDHTRAGNIPPGFDASIAAHANHLLYSLDLIHQWAEGDPNPFATADWGSSWNVGKLDEREWARIRTRLRERAQYWIDFLATPREWEPIALSGAVSTLPHIAYHLGAIKQLLKVA